MSIQIDYNDPRYAQAAAEILRRYDNGEPEANITSAVYRASKWTLLSNPPGTWSS